MGCLIPLGNVDDIGEAMVLDEVLALVNIG